MTDMSQTGRIALVTGASRGIGRACAIGLARAGAQVVACARSKAALEELDDEIFAATGQHAALVPFDLTEGDAIDRLSGVLFERFGRLDTLVHAAAISGTLMPVAHQEPKDFDKIVALNLTAAWRLIRATELLLRQSAAGRAVFFTTGDSVTKGRAFWGPYGATKAAMETLVRAWADELAITPIRAVLLSPGAMRTKMRAAAYPGEDPQTLPHPDEIVPLLLELCDPARIPPLDTVSFRAGRVAAQTTN